MLPNGYWKNVEKIGNDKSFVNIKRTVWTNYTDKMWPTICSIENCSNEATIAAAVKRYNADIRGVVPVCCECSKKKGFFKLKWVPIAPY